MLVLADEATLLHETVELLGSKLIAALESPERIRVLLKAISECPDHELRLTSTASEDDPTEVDTLLNQLILESHDKDYIDHLRTIHATWLRAGHIHKNESVLPECFRIPGMGRKPEPPTNVFARWGYYAFDMSTGVGKDTWLSAWVSAGLAVKAVLALKEGDCGTDESSEGVKIRSSAADQLTDSKSASGITELKRNVLALCRPPGHHCTTDMAGGYCYVNNVVVAVHTLWHQHRTIAAGEANTKPKIAILDLDFHHGNGTQVAFYDDPSVLYVSIHGKDEYPYYFGHEDETGSGEGKGYNMNIPLPTGSDMEAYLNAVDMAVARLVEFAPGYLLVSLGFDTFHTDPLGCFQIETPDYANIAKKVRQLSNLDRVPSVILLEGGYVVDSLGDNMLSFLRGWEGR